MLALSLDHLGLITQPDNEKEKGARAEGLARIVEDIGNGKLLQLSDTEMMLRIGCSPRTAKIGYHKLFDAKGQGRRAHKSAQDCRR